MNTINYSDKSIRRLAARYSSSNLPTNVFVEVTLHDQSEESLVIFEAAVAEYSDVMECYLMSGDADYLLRVTTADTTDFERVHKLLGQLPKLARTRSSFVLRTVSKRTKFDI